MLYFGRIEQASAMGASEHSPYLFQLTHATVGDGIHPLPPVTSSTQTVGPMARTVATVALRSRPCSRIRRFWRHKLLRLKATWHLRSHLTRKLRQRCSHILFVLQCFCLLMVEMLNCNRFNGSLINKCDVTSLAATACFIKFPEVHFWFQFQSVYSDICTYTRQHSAFYAVWLHDANAGR